MMCNYGGNKSGDEKGGTNQEKVQSAEQRVHLTV
jgi:hypothetical protein